MLSSLTLLAEQPAVRRIQLLARVVVTESFFKLNWLTSEPGKTKSTDIL